MLKRFNPAPISQFSRITGRYNTLAPFFYMSGMQESLTGNNVTIANDCYNTKVYTTDSSITLRLLDGRQDGQLKKISFIFQGNIDSIVTVECPTLIDIFSHIVFTNVGDQILLMWTGGQWCVLETINIMDPTLLTPIIE